MGALYFGVGKALGSLVGGLVIEDIGVRNTFRCFSVTCLVTASVYFCFNFFTEKRNRKSRADDPEEVTSNDETKDDAKPKEIISRKNSETSLHLNDIKSKEEDSRCT